VPRHRQQQEEQMQQQSVKLSGRELDAAVCRDVFDIPPHWIHFEPNGKYVDLKGDGEFRHIAPVEHYSGEDFWEVVQQMHELGFWCVINVMRRGEVHVQFGTSLGEPVFQENHEEVGMAVCRAALQACAALAAQTRRGE
jgi:hypothetical protein